MKVKKAGCILLNIEKKQVGLIYRSKQQDYSFPKGHMEKGESLEECAIRETEEETGRKCVIIPLDELPIMEYIDSKGQETRTYYYLAIDKGKSEKNFDSEQTHDLLWVSIEDVENRLSYQSLIDFWKEIKFLVIGVFENETS